MSHKDWFPSSLAASFWANVSRWAEEGREDDERPVETLSSVDRSCRVPGSASESYQST